MYIKLVGMGGGTLNCRDLAKVGMRGEPLPPILRQNTVDVVSKTTNTI